MRVTSAIWVSALIRRAQAGGAFATLLNKGATEAGAVFLVANDMQGQLSFYGPAPQSDYTSEGAMDRQFECIMETTSAEDIEQKIARERAFDPDIWVVEIEDRQGRIFLVDSDGQVGHD